MTKHYKLLAAIILGSSTLSSCGSEQITVPDFVFCGWEGPAGGPGAACACAHTLKADIPVAHYDLNTCLGLLRGAVFTQGENFNTMQANIDTLCTRNPNSCNYQQNLRTAIQQVKKIIPRR